VHMYHCPTERSEILHDENVKRLLISCENEESNYHMVWDRCNTDQDKLEVSFKASRVFVAAGRRDESVYWIRRLLSLLRNDPRTNDKELGTFLSVLGSCLTGKTEHEEAINVLGEAMLKIKNIPESEEKHLLVRENYFALGVSFQQMNKDLLAIYYLTMYHQLLEHLEHHDNVIMEVNFLLSVSYYRIGQFEQAIKYAQDGIHMAKDEHTLFHVGDAYMALEEFPKAYKYHVDAFKLLKSHPDPVHRHELLPRSYGSVAKCQMKMKHYSLAIKNYTKAINLIVPNNSDTLKLYLKESSHCHAMLGQFQEAYDQNEKAFEISLHVINGMCGLACNVINNGLLHYRMKKQKHTFLSKFFNIWMSETSPIRFMAMCLRELFPEDLALFKKFLTQYLDNKKRRNPQVVAQEIRPHFRRVCNSVMMSRHIHTSALSLRRSLMNQ
jgi:tetratricopeptide (TPR) repeat protein